MYESYMVVGSLEKQLLTIHDTSMKVRLVVAQVTVGDYEPTREQITRRDDAVSLEYLAECAEGAQAQSCSAMKYSGAYHALVAERPG